MAVIRFDPIKGAAGGAEGATHKAGRGQDGWKPFSSVPDGVPPAPVEHYSKGLPSVVFAYRGPMGQLLGFIWRFNFPEGKEFFPVTYCQHAKSGECAWRFKSWDVPRPLYGLDRLAKRPSAPVILVEGEGAAEAAQKLLPGWVAVTSPGGSKAASKADWAPLVGRRVVIWPDADEAGERYAHEAAAAIAKAGGE